MKYKYILLVLLALFSSVHFASAESTGHGGKIDSIVSEILATQNVSSTSKIDCELVSSDELEKLGDAVMGIMHPDENEHELMGQMMGGEGSTQLSAMHKMMGLNYLGCSSGTDSFNGMMGGGMHVPYRTEGSGMGMGGGWSLPQNNGFNLNSMMGFGYIPFGWIGFLFMAIFWILLIAGIVYFIKWLAGERVGARSKTAIEIISERYAKGEIDKKEFEEIKKNLSE